MKWHGNEGLQIEFATENVHQLLGYTTSQIANGNIFYLSLIHPDDQARFNEELNSCRNLPDCQEVAHQPYRIIAANGSIKWVQDHKALSRNEDGQVIGYHGLVTDITRQRQQSSAIRNIISSVSEKRATTTLDNLTLLAAETLAADYALIAEIQPAGTARSCRRAAKPHRSTTGSMTCTPAFAPSWQPARLVAIPGMSAFISRKTCG